MHATELKEMKLVGIRIVCKGDQYAIEIPNTAATLKKRLKEIKQVVSPVRLVGAFIVGDFSEEEDGYWVCVEVNEYKDIPEGMVVLTVPSQRYAVIKHSGSHREIINTYEVLHRWIEANCFARIHHSWHLEISKEWSNSDAKAIEVELYDTIK